VCQLLSCSTVFRSLLRPPCIRLPFWPDFTAMGKQGQSWMKRINAPAAWTGTRACPSSHVIRRSLHGCHYRGHQPCHVLFQDMCHSINHQWNGPYQDNARLMAFTMACVGKRTSECGGVEHHRWREKKGSRAGPGGGVLVASLPLPPKMLPRTGQWMVDGCYGG
jgi:hypothetical protein